MKLLFKRLLFLTSSTVLATQLYAMEEQPKRPKKIRRLTEIADNALKQAQLAELQATYPDFIQNTIPVPIVELANYILGLFQYESPNARAQALNALELKQQFRVGSYFLKGFAQSNTSDDCHRIAFINHLIKLLDGPNLLNFRYKLLDCTGELIKLINNNPLGELSARTFREKLETLVNSLDLITEKATQIPRAISEQKEQVPLFDTEFEETAKRVIEEQDMQGWNAFTSDLLKTKGIEPENFLKYLFAVHIPSKKFDSQPSFRENCKEMTVYIDKVLIACQPESDLNKIFHYLLTLYPSSTNLLYTYNHAINAKKLVNNRALNSTLLCPKLFLLYQLKNIFIISQCKILTNLLNNNKTDECAATIRNMYYTFLDTRLVSLLLHDMLKLNTAGKLTKDKFSRLTRLANSLESCLSNIQLPNEIIEQLSGYYTTHIKNFFSPNATIPQVEELINNFQTIFKKTSSNF